jgi:hypothetical protein
MRIEILNTKTKKFGKKLAGVKITFEFFLRFSKPNKNIGRFCLTKRQGLTLSGIIRAIQVRFK